MIVERQICTFRVAGNWYGLDVLDVQEIVPPPTLTRVPLAPLEIAGLLNLRGQILTAIDLRRRLGLPEREPQGEMIHVVVRTSAGPVSLVADEIGDVINLRESDFESPPATLQGQVRELFEGVYKLADRLIVTLALERVVQIRSEAG